MNDHVLAADLATVLAGDPVFLAKIPNIHGPLSGEIANRPSLVITGQFTPYGTRRIGALDFELKSRLADEPAFALAGAGHQDLFAALYAKLFAAGAKAALQALILGLGHAELIEYGPFGPTPIESDAVGEDLRTVLHLQAVWRFL